MLAQFPLPTTGGSVFEWCAAAVAVVWIASTVLKAVNEYKRHNKALVDDAREFVTRGEFDEAMAAIDKERETGISSVAISLKEHEQYTHTRFHEQANALQILTLKLAEQPQQMRAMVDAAIAPLQRKMDSLMMSQAAMCAKMDIELPRENPI